MRNAFEHAQAKRIEVEIRYDEPQFRLRRPNRSENREAWG